MVPRDETSRRALEQLWDMRLRHARTRYFRSAAEFHRRLLQDPGERGVETAETALVRRAEAQAFAEYCRVLATFTELTAGEEAPLPSPSATTSLSPRVKIL